MIDKLIIKNWEGYKKAVLKFHPGVNVIIGPSDGGKSSIFRVIDWIRNNRPLGEEFKSVWGGETKGVIKVDNKKVMRFKGKTNGYQIGNQQPLTGFGTKPPQSIIDILNIDDINIQYQDESPFLLSLSSGEVAQFLNKAANIEDIDKVMSGLKEGYRKAKTEKEYNKERLKDQKEKLEKYKNLSELEGRVKVLEDTETNLIRLFQRKNKLNKIINTIQKLEDSIKKSNLNKIERVFKLITLVENKTKEIEMKQRTIDGLNRSINQIIKLSSELQNIEQKKSNAEKEFNKLMPNICPFCSQVIEKWKSIVGFKGFYEVSNYGNIRTYHQPRNKKVNTSPPYIKEQTVDKDGYKRVSLYKTTNNKKYNTVKGVHQLVLESFIGPCPDGKESSHLDGDPTNNNLNNLIWETHIENNKRRKKHGTWYKTGEEHPNYGRHFSKEIRKKMSEAQKNSNRKYSKETRKKLSDAAKKRWWK